MDFLVVIVNLAQSRELLVRSNVPWVSWTNSRSTNLPFCSDFHESHCCNKNHIFWDITVDIHSFHLVTIVAFDIYNSFSIIVLMNFVNITHFFVRKVGPQSVFTYSRANVCKLWYSNYKQICDFDFYSYCIIFDTTLPPCPQVKYQVFVSFFG